PSINLFLCGKGHSRLAWKKRRLVGRHTPRLGHDHSSEPAEECAAVSGETAGAKSPPVFPSFWVSDFPSLRVSDFPSFRVSDFPSFCVSDFPSLRRSDFPSLLLKSFGFV